MAKQQSIEQLIGQIEGVLEELDDGELSLEDSLKRYEAGLKAVRQAQQQLDRFEARLEELRGDEMAEADGGE